MLNKKQNIKDNSDWIAAFESCTSMCSRGFLLGSVAMGEWTERPTAGKTVFEVWDELYNIDKTIVENAAKTLTSAKKYLEKRNNDGNN